MRLMTVSHAMFFGLLCFLPGCGNDPAKLPQEVKGEVFFSGQPLADGTIYFQPTDGNPPTTAQIQEGRYLLSVVPGEYRVEIRSFKDRIPNPGPPHDPKINFLPPRYNSTSELKAVVKPEPGNEISFKLEAK